MSVRPAAQTAAVGAQSQGDLDHAPTAIDIGVLAIRDQNLQQPAGTGAHDLLRDFFGFDLV
jgi:hypothetical protein